MKCHKRIAKAIRNLSVLTLHCIFAEPLIVSFFPVFVTNVTCHRSLGCTYQLPIMHYNYIYFFLTRSDSLESRLDINENHINQKIPKSCCRECIVNEPIKGSEGIHQHLNNRDFDTQRFATVLSTTSFSHCSHLERDPNDVLNKFRNIARKCIFCFIKRTEQLVLFF